MTNLQPSRRDLGFLFGGNVLFGAGLFFHAFLYNFYLEAIGHAEAVMGYAAASLTAGALAALLPAGKLVDARGPRLVLCTGVMLGVLGLAAGALVAAPAAVYAAAALAGAGAAATPDTPLAWLRLEPDGIRGSAAILLTLWPGGETRALGRGDYHGRFADWHDP